MSWHFLNQWYLFRKRRMCSCYTFRFSPSEFGSGASHVCGVEQVITLGSWIPLTIHVPAMRYLMWNHMFKMEQRIRPAAICKWRQFSNHNKKVVLLIEKRFAFNINSIMSCLLFRQLGSAIQISFWPYFDNIFLFPLLSKIRRADRV